MLILNDIVSAYCHKLLENKQCQSSSNVFRVQPTLFQNIVNWINSLKSNTLPIFVQIDCWTYVYVYIERKQIFLNYFA